MKKLATVEYGGNHTAGNLLIEAVYNISCNGIQRGKVAADEVYG